MDEGLKDAIEQYWDASPCGEIYAGEGGLRARLQSQATARYSLEPYIEPFARFEEAVGEDLLEVGVGMGADHARFARAQPKYLAGVDLTSTAVNWTRQRLAAYGFSSDLRVADAERLPFEDNSFSMVYSWGVIHHTPDPQSAVNELRRVLRPGGRARVMIYHRDSITGFVLWLRYALLSGAFHRTMDEVYRDHLESPGTKAYSLDEAMQLFSQFHEKSIRPQLSFADMMEGSAGAGHNQRLIVLSRKVWPRWIISRYLSRYGLYLLVEAVK